MDWRIFLAVLGIGWGNISMQGVFAWHNGWFSQTRLQLRGIRNAWSFTDHGGTRADVFLITPLVAYLAGKYSFPYLSLTGLSVLSGSCVPWYVLVSFIYEPGGVQEPEA